MVGVVILHWTLVLTVGIGCVVVMMMKGPAYVADTYPLSDSDLPAAAKERYNALNQVFPPSGGG